MPRNTGPPHPHQHPLPAGGDAYDVEAVLLAGDRKEGCDPRVVRQNLGEGITRRCRVERHALSSHRQARAIQPQAAEHMRVATLVVMQVQGRSLTVVVFAAPQAVGTNQPQPITVECQSLDIRFAVAFPSRQIEVFELHSLEVAVAVLTDALQPVEAAALITPQPEHSFGGSQGGNSAAISRPLSHLSEPAQGCAAGQRQHLGAGRLW